jgi:alkyl sulfatase BDS1-like metallo-beta-lactamase superfamily hydrolase
MAKGALTIEGRREAFTEFMGLLDTFPFWFDIVTPSRGGMAAWRRGGLPA